MKAMKKKYILIVDDDKELCEEMESVLEESGHEVFIVNTGEEAKSKNQLRGEIFESENWGIGGLKQKEVTRYTGTHWIECFIVSDNVCLARSGEFIVNIE